MIGWRVWMISGGQLCSVITHHVWKPGRPLQAECFTTRRPTRRHLVPDRDCDCGIYGCSGPSGVLTAHAPHLREGRAVLGVIEAWGRTVPHRYGFRSQFGHPTVLYAPPGLEDELLPVARCYRVPLISMADEYWFTPTLLGLLRPITSLS